jgi:hypothetical protein
MPARTVQRVESIPCEQWRSFCLECQWVGDEVYSEGDCARQAFDHNRDHHDGAGVDFELKDVTRLTISKYRTYQKMYRRGLTTAGVSILVGCLTVMFTEEAVLQALFLGINVGAAAANAFLAGKWAARMEACLLMGEFPRNDERPT